MPTYCIRSLCQPTKVTTDPSTPDRTSPAMGTSITSRTGRRRITARNSAVVTMADRLAAIM
ncbi:hypothetical protein MGSAQ_000429, partial [marine sediment metagenome]